MLLVLEINGALIRLQPLHARRTIHWVLLVVLAHRPHFAFVSFGLLLIILITFLSTCRDLGVNDAAAVRRVCVFHPYVGDGIDLTELTLLRFLFFRLQITVLRSHHCVPIGSPYLSNNWLNFIA